MPVRKSIAATVLLLVIILSATAIWTPLVQADTGGTGKFLTIEIDGEGYVRATKVRSGEIWYFYPAEDPVKVKVGAGTVLLEAFASEDSEFSHWEGDITGSTPTVDYKTEKYGYVVAVFVKKTYTIIASAVGNGAIDPSGEVSVEYGAMPTFDFMPYAGAHISAILVDDVSQSYSTNYTFPPVYSNHEITVYFDPIGTATVTPGTNRVVFLDEEASITIPEVTSQGTVSYENLYFAYGWVAALWEIEIPVSDVATISLPYDENDLPTGFDESSLRMFKSDSVDALYSDVNDDGMIDGDDVSDVANAIKALTLGDPDFDPILDVNRDGILDESDIHMINDNKGALLLDITAWVDTENNIIHGIAPAGSVYKIR